MLLNDFPADAGGNGIRLHMPTLYTLASSPRFCPNGRVVEVGTGCGDGSTLAFAWGVRDNPAPVPEGKRHVGVCIHPPSKEWEEKAAETGYWSFVLGDSTEGETVFNAAACLTVNDPNEVSAYGPIVAHRVLPVKADILYIDTLHTYEQMKRELEIWPAICDDATTYLFHDTYMGGSYNPMTDAIKEFWNENLKATHFYVDFSLASHGLTGLLPRK